jgi:hypothetical protein
LLPSLIGHLCYGLTVAAVFVLLRRELGVARSATAAGPVVRGVVAGVAVAVAVRLVAGGMVGVAAGRATRPHLAQLHGHGDLPSQERPRQAVRRGRRPRRQRGRAGFDWTSPADADAFAAAGVTLFTTGIEPTDDGYDFTELTGMLAWRDSRR